MKQLEYALGEENVEETGNGKVANPKVDKETSLETYI